MFTWILGFWGGIPAPVKKILMYVGIALLALWAFKVFYLNPHDDKIEREGRLQAIKEMDKQYQKKWEDAQKQLTLDKQALDSQAKSLAEQRQLNEAKMKEIAQARAQLKTLSDKIETQSKAAMEINNAAASSVPGDKLDDAIRAVSRELPQPVFPPVN